MNELRKYASLFRMRFLNGLQYRAAALAGLATQFAWGFLLILLYRAFYRADPGALPMEFSALVSYTWLQQAFLALYMTWFFENDIFEAITGGNIAYELCRPVDLYAVWFSRSAAARVVRASLRCVPVLLVAVLLPDPFRLSPPAEWRTLGPFLLSMVLGLLVMVACTMLVYILSFYTISPRGLRIVAMSLMDFFSGQLLPLPFLPDGLRQVLELLPFASIQNVPFRVYSGDIGGADALIRIGLQGVWLAALVLLGRVLMRRALRRVVVQGG